MTQTPTIECENCERPLEHVESRSFLTGNDRSGLLGTESYEVYHHAKCGECDEDRTIPRDGDYDSTPVYCPCYFGCGISEVWIDGNGVQHEGDPRDA